MTTEGPGVSVAGRVDLLGLRVRLPGGLVTTLGGLVGEAALRQLAEQASADFEGLRAYATAELLRGVEVETLRGWRSVGELTYGELSTAGRGTGTAAGGTVA